MVNKKGTEKVLLIENERKFTQTKGTSLTISPLLDELGLLCIGKAAMKYLMENTYHQEIWIEMYMKY